MIMRNVVRVAKRKTHELRPRKRALGRFGSKNVGVRRSTVSTYEV